MFIRKSKAHWLRWIHLIKHTFLNIFGSSNEIHLGYTEQDSTLFFGIQIWYKSKKIACTCGKVWYEED